MEFESCRGKGESYSTSQHGAVVSHWTTDPKVWGSNPKMDIEWRRRGQYSTGRNGDNSETTQRIRLKLYVDVKETIVHLYAREETHRIDEDGDMELMAKGLLINIRK